MFDKVTKVISGKSRFLYIPTEFNLVNSVYKDATPGPAW